MGLLLICELLMHSPAAFPAELCVFKRIVALASGRASHQPLPEIMTAKLVLRGL